MFDVQECSEVSGGLIAFFPRHPQLRHFTHYCLNITHIIVRIKTNLMATPRKIPPRIELNAERGADCCLKQFSLGLELILKIELKSQEVIIQWVYEPVG